MWLKHLIVTWMTRKGERKWYYVYSNCFSNSTDHYKHLIVSEDWSFSEVNPDTIELLYSHEKSLLGIT